MSDPYQPSRRPGSTVSLYSVHGVVIGTVLGSLAAGIVMLFLNYRALGKGNLARLIAIWGTVLCVVVVLLTSFAPNTPAFALLFMTLQGTIAYFLAARLQGAAITWHQQHSGHMHSSFRAAGVGFLTGMAILLALMLVSGLVGGILPLPSQAPGSPG